MSVLTGSAGTAAAGRRAPVAVALDAPDAATAVRWARAVAPHVELLKVGMELFYREGPAVVSALRGERLLADPAAAPDTTLAAAAAPGLFLDLKLHDIPVTVAGAMRSVARLRPRFVTVHAVGGQAMVRAAVEAAAATAAEVGGPPAAVAAVTVLTSLGEPDLAAVGLAGPALDAVVRLAVLAVEAGATALVASPWEAARLRTEVGNDVTLITPGVRPRGGDKADQTRVATPEEALEAGADVVVMGRPITGSDDPGAVAAGLAATLRPRPRVADLH
jgi:orotidine-5'-phosphate decarboxylase